MTASCAASGRLLRRMEYGPPGATHESQSGGKAAAPPGARGLNIGGYVLRAAQGSPYAYRDRADDD